MVFDLNPLKTETVLSCMLSSKLDSFDKKVCLGRHCFKRLVQQPLNHTRAQKKKLTKQGSHRPATPVFCEQT